MSTPTSPTPLPSHGIKEICRPVFIHSIFRTPFDYSPYWQQLQTFYTHGEMLLCSESYSKGEFFFPQRWHVSNNQFVALQGYGEPIFGRIINLFYIECDLGTNFYALVVCTLEDWTLTPS